MRLVTMLVLGFLCASPAWAKKPPPPPPAAWNVTADRADELKAAADLLFAKKFDEAAAAYQAIVTAEPDCGMALWGLGRSLLGAGRPAEAVAPLARATSLFPDRYEPWVNLGQAQNASGDATAALASAKAALKIKPLVIDAHHVAQKALITLGDHAQAHAMIQTARETSWMVQWDCFDGFLYVAEKKPDEARASLEKCKGVPDPAIYEALAAQVQGMAAPPSAAPTP